jgi:CxxC motif-containing protein (DUF1111 family)
MKYLKISVLFVFAAALVVPFAYTRSVEGQAASEAPTHDMNATTPSSTVSDVFNQVDYDGDGDSDAADVARFDVARDAFEEVEGVAQGLGPVYNTQSCRECHQNPETGGGSQITEFRAGHLDFFGNFVDAPGGSLINQRAVAAAINERISTAETETTRRVSLQLFGDGFVEAIANGTLTANVNAQPGAQRGTLINVAVFEDGATLRVGRFGHKDQQASLVSFSADAYLNEMGITSNFAQTNTENTSNGNSVAAFDTVADPEDPDNEDVENFAAFMRGLRAPGRGPQNASTNAGSVLFDVIGCAVCHTRNFTTAAVGTLINGGAFTVPFGLGNKVIHPFSDFALHNIGTGDGIVQNGGQATRNQVRTAVLWGVRTKNELMHDAEEHTINDSILRHAGQATTARNNFNGLSNTNKTNLIAFVLSL